MAFRLRKYKRSKAKMKGNTQAIKIHFLVPYSYSVKKGVIVLPVNCFTSVRKNKMWRAIARPTIDEATNEDLNPFLQMKYL